MNRNNRQQIPSSLDGKKRSYENFSATLLIIAGFIYLVLWLVSIFSETSRLVNVNDDRISIKMSELLGHIRTFITILFSILGSIMIYKKKRWGWILGITVLLLLLIICSGAVYQAVSLNDHFLIAVAGGGWLILFFSVLILLTASVRSKLKVNKPTVITAGLFSVFLIFFYFFFQ